MSLNRRKFIKLSSAGLLGLSALNLDILKDEIGTQEISIAELTSNHHKSGYSWAESIFLSSVKYLKKPEELVSISTGFGGGIKMKDLCGFYTGGVMGIGLFCRKVKAEDREASKKCSKLTREYTKWWKGNFPMHCRDIRTEESTREVCEEVGKKASEFIQKLFERES